MRVKTLMGLERFEVSIKSRPNSQSLGNYEGIEFGTKKNFAVSLLAQEGIKIENCFGTNCAEGTFASQNFKRVYSDLKFMF